MLQSDLGYVPIAWGALYAAVKPWVRGLQRNRAGDLVVDGNIYADMLGQLYVVDKSQLDDSPAPPASTAGLRR